MYDLKKRVPSPRPDLFPLTHGNELNGKRAHENTGNDINHLALLSTVTLLAEKNALIFVSVTLGDALFYALN